MATLLQANLSNIKMTFRRSGDVNNVRTSLIQKFWKVSKAAFDRESVGELLGHQRLLIAHSNDFTILYTLDLGGVEIGDLATSDYGDLKQAFDPGCRLRCSAVGLRQWTLSVPSQLRLQFLVGVPRLLPFAVPTPSGEGRRQLSVRPLRIFLPEIAERITHRVWHIHGFEVSGALLIKAREITAGGQVIIHHVKNLSIHTFHQPSQHNSFRTVIEVRKRYGVRAAEMKERSECADAHASGDVTLHSPIDAARSDQHIGHSSIFAIFGHELLLPDFREAICVAAKLWMIFDRTGFIQNTCIGFVTI